MEITHKPRRRYFVNILAKYEQAYQTKLDVRRKMTVKLNQIAMIYKVLKMWNRGSLKKSVLSIETLHKSVFSIDIDRGQSKATISFDRGQSLFR